MGYWENFLRLTNLEQFKSTPPPKEILDLKKRLEDLNKRINSIYDAMPDSPKFRQFWNSVRIHLQAASVKFNRKLEAYNAFSEAYMKSKTLLTSIDENNNRRLIQKQSGLSGLPNPEFYMHTLVPLKKAISAQIEWDDKEKRNVHKSVKRIRAKIDKIDSIISGLFQQIRQEATAIKRDIRDLPANIKSKSSKNISTLSEFITGLEKSASSDSVSELRSKLMKEWNLNASLLKKMEYLDSILASQMRYITSLMQASLEFTRRYNRYKQTQNPLFAKLWVESLEHFAALIMSGATNLSRSVMYEQYALKDVAELLGTVIRIEGQKNSINEEMQSRIKEELMQARLMATQVKGIEENWQKKFSTENIRSAVEHLFREIEAQSSTIPGSKNPEKKSRQIEEEAKERLREILRDKAPDRFQIKRFTKRLDERMGAMIREYLSDRRNLN